MTRIHSHHPPFSPSPSSSLSLSSFSSPRSAPAVCDCENLHGIRALICLGPVWALCSGMLSKCIAVSSCPVLSSRGNVEGTDWPLYVKGLWASREFRVLEFEAPYSSCTLLFLVAGWCGQPTTCCDLFELVTTCLRRVLRDLLCLLSFPTVTRVTLLALSVWGFCRGGVIPW